MTAIRSGDKVGVRIHGHSVMRIVYTATDSHVVIMTAGRATEIPITELTEATYSL